MEGVLNRYVDGGMGWVGKWSVWGYRGGWGTGGDWRGGLCTDGGVQRAGAVCTVLVEHSAAGRLCVYQSCHDAWHPLRRYVAIRWQCVGQPYIYRKLQCFAPFFLPATRSPTTLLLFPQFSVYVAKATFLPTACSNFVHEFDIRRREGSPLGTTGKQGANESDGSIV